ncbi:hypothetical protein [Nonomuraea rubra]|uniref:DUF2029 domain-containing protein n=1 Tax=Nonomuraea rubra TaxID=46180 RepID=A0A7X0NV15_9ACTN|nr:hypothetical protein [Nonomuraea rubra]MBB6550115.1 hypothetical protein [Nonomuraea rubra]
MTVIRPLPSAALDAGRAALPPPWVLLALVSCAYALSQLLIGAPWTGLGWDEAVYASQYAGHAPPAPFSAPRARGVPLLVAPVVAVTDSVPVLRLYLVALSSLGLFAAFAVWLRVRDSRAVPLAALLFAGCWLSLFYGGQAMPNLYVALAAVAAAGAVVTGRAPVGLGVAFAVMSLMRPSDALVAAAVLGVAALAVPAWRRTRSLVAIAAGTAVGWGLWLAEAELAYGGMLRRLRDAGEHNATGWSFTLAEHARALDGPSLCRFGTDCGPVSPVALIWWLAIPAMVAAGLWAAWRERRPGPALLATACGVSLALPYLFYVGYAAPRFLMPAYALLALPAADAVTALFRRRLGAALMSAGLLAHLALQGAYAYRMGHGHVAGRERLAQAAEHLRQQGVRPPCLIYGESGVQLGYLLGCESQGVIQRFAERQPARVRRALERGYQVVVVHAGVRPPGYVAGWPGTDLPGRWKARFGHAIR